MEEEKVLGTIGFHRTSTSLLQWHKIRTSSLAIEASIASHSSRHHEISLTAFANKLNLDLPPVKPSAIALGTVFNHAVSLAVLAPVFGETYNSAQAANTKEEFLKSKQAATAAATWGSSLLGSAVQTYGVGALINATGTLSYKGAAYLGSLVFFASAAPSVCSFLQNGILYSWLI